ncbi:hypothetical protein [Endozoicomonas sp. ISHI1]|uniref:hypothetical protein n=1 Tax=Endozoicomonas sp. ISHI1 TaxID=2825882 RepID=UPI00214739A4|nr:hypothetical protein [Endozoicomonas sp. ISHI1]
MRRHYIVEPGLKRGLTNRSFSIETDQHAPPDKPPDIINTNGYEGSDSLPDDKPQRPSCYGIKSTLIESIAWQWLYASRLLVDYKLILTTSDATLCYSPCSWVPVKVVVVLRWLLKSYWNPDSLLFDPMKRQMASQDHPFAITAMMHSPGHVQKQGQPSESSGQQVPQAPPQPTSSFTSSLYCGSVGGNRGSQQHQHTLGLDCFVHPCNGVCSLRLSSGSREFAEWPLNSLESSCPHLAYGHCISCIDNFDFVNTSLSKTMDGPPVNQRQWSGQLFLDGVAVALDGVALSGVTSYSVTAGAASTAEATWQKTCDMTVVGEDGHQRPCGKIFRNTRLFTVHKNRYHCEPKICGEVMIGDNGQPQPCRKVCKNAKALSDHKSRAHCGPKTCDVIVFGEDGQQRPCGTICRNPGALSGHKSSYHTGKKSCDLTVIGGDGQPRPCGKVFKNAGSLSSHKSIYHTGQKTCDAAVIGEDGQSRPCGSICKDAGALSVHKRAFHSGQKNCDLRVIGEDGQQQPCGKLCKNAKDLSQHKRRHRKRKPVDKNRDDDLSPQKSKVNK